jgi:hypothetical protein
MKKSLQNANCKNSFRETSDPGSIGVAPPAPDGASFEPAVRVESPASFQPNETFASLPLSYFVGREVWVPCQTRCGMVENLTVKVTGIDGGDLVGTLDKWRIFAEELNGVTTVKVSPVQIGSVGLSLEEWHGQALSLMKTADFHNYWRGQPRGWLFDQLYAEGFSPIDALEVWRDWEPVEND